MFMLTQIIQRTPLWVWCLLCALLILGLLQTKQRTASLKAVLIPSLGLSLFSIYGAIRILRASLSASTNDFAIAVWLWIMIVSGFAWLQARRTLKADTSFDRHNSNFQLPGSWIPMGLILLTFLANYSMNVQVAINPALKSHMGFTFGYAFVLAVLSGLFLGRSFRLIRLAKYQ